MRKPEIDVARIESAMAAVIGETPDLVPIVEGEESRAFRMHQGGAEYVVRVSRSATGFAKDAFAARHFAGPDLPIPAVLYIGQLDGGLAFCLSEHVPGRTLQALASSELPPLLAPTARVLHAIAAVDVTRTTGYGPFDEDGVGAFATWHDYLLSIAQPSRYDWQSLVPLLDPRRVAAHFRRIEDLSAACPEQRQLIHGDFGSNNVLTDGSRITGVIDWSEAMWGDPLYDVANILFWRTWLDCMEQQARYVETTIVSQAHIHDRLQCYQLRIGLDVIYQAAIAGETSVAAWALARCGEIDRTIVELDADRAFNRPDESR